MQWVSRVGGPEEQQWVIAGVQKSVQVQAGRRSAWNTNFANSAKQKQSKKKKKKGEQTNKQKTFLGVLCYIRWQRCSHLSSHCACWEWCSETQLLRNCQTPTAKTVYNMLWLPVVPSEWPRSFSRPPPILLCFLLSITNSLSQYGLYYTILAVMIFYPPNDNTQWSSIWSSIQCVTMH